MLVETTVAALGDQLPVGRPLPDDTRARGFAFRPGWSAATETEIGALRENDRAMTPGRFATEVLARFLTAFAGKDYTKLTLDQRKSDLAHAWAADVYHVWIQLRRKVLGNEFPMDIACGACRKRFIYEVDLGTLEVLTPEPGGGLRWEYDLRDGFHYRGAQRKRLTLGPIQWFVYEGMGAHTGINVGAIKLIVIGGAIKQVEGSEEDVSVGVPALGTLEKFDLEDLTLEVDEGQPGPDLTLELTCPGCKTMIRESLTWTYDAFFSSRRSSGGGRRRRSGRKSLRSQTTSPASATPSKAPAPKIETSS